MSFAVTNVLLNKNISVSQWLRIYHYATTGNNIITKHILTLLYIAEFTINVQNDNL